MKLAVVSYVVIVIGAYIGLAVHDELAKIEGNYQFGTVQRVGLAILWPILWAGTFTLALARICDIADYVIKSKAD